MRRLPLVLVAALFATSLDVDGARADYDFSWGRSGEDREFDERMANAQVAIAELSSSRRGLRERRDMARIAYRKLASALERKPNHAEANYLAAELIIAWELYDYGNRSRWLDRGIDHYARYLASKPVDTRMRSVLFNRAILYSKRALGLKDFEPDFRRAIDDYDRQLAMLDSDSLGSGNRRQILSTTLSNAAELHMGVGQLDRAIELYAQAIDIEPNALYSFGLAIALDRDGQRLRAAEIMQEAIATDKPDHDGRCALHRQSVFFVPNGDKSYYLALRAEVLGKNAEARRHYQVFLNRLGDGRYARVARANLAALRDKRDTWVPTTKDCQ